MVPSCLSKYFSGIPCKTGTPTNPISFSCAADAIASKKQKECTIPGEGFDWVSVDKELQFFETDSLKSSWS